MKQLTSNTDTSNIYNRGLAAWWDTVCKDFKKNKSIYAVALPGMLFYIIFMYIPMYGVIIAFKEYSPAGGILGSTWVGLEHFRSFFGSAFCSRLIKNTVLINLFGLIFGFPIPIIFALLLNELRGKYFKMTVQTITYLPHFISMVVVCGMLVDFTSSNGLITGIVNNITGSKYSNLLQEAKFFRTIYISSDIWQNFGWGSILYLAALCSLDMELYEAAMIDGAKKFRQLIHITLPGIAPTIIIMLILTVGSMMSLGADKVILLYNPAIYGTADTISSYIYRKGLIGSEYSFSAAVGLFNSLINCILIYSANYISGKFGESNLF